MAVANYAKIKGYEFRMVEDSHVEKGNIRIHPEDLNKILSGATDKRFENLLKIKGIGPETVEDIKRVWSDFDDFKRALEENRVPLRNDLVCILKDSFLGIEKGRSA